MIGWDGGARAARAVGDAMPLLTRAEQVEIVCVSPDASKGVSGAALSAHLARHCKNMMITDLPTQHVGGVTNGVLSEAELPVLLSY
jgi:hypothetical protein